MARPTKKGIDYYPIDVDFLQDIKVRKIMRACGVQSITILISLLSSIYRDEGYYVVWDSDMSFLVADEVGASEGAVLEVVNKSVQVDFFNKRYFDKYKVLTSRGIQKRFLEAVTRRKRIDLISEYLLVNIDIEYKNLVNVYIYSINDGRSTQSKEEKSKEEKSKETTGGRSEKIAIVTRAFEENGFGTINATIREMLIDLINQYSTEWILEAMKIAVKANVRRLNYVEGILNRWQTEGGMKKGGMNSGITSNGHKRAKTKADEDEARRAGVTLL